MTELINKYRPKTFAEVVGHHTVIKSLQAALKKGSAHTFMFSGPRGTGKTTLARIAAEAAGCSAHDLIEIDGATNTGIDDMRAVTATLMYQPLGGGAKAIIVDEVQAISKAAVSSLLKITEEPPSWTYWFLCTTEPTRISEALRSRCTHYTLKPVGLTTLIELLDDVARKEKLKVEDAVIDLCAKQADGSPRQALSNLSVCAEAKNAAEARELLRQAEEPEQAVALARALIKDAKWSDIQPILEGLKEVNPESVRHVVRAYVSAVVLKARSEGDAGFGVQILDAFSEPFHSADGIAPLLVACGRIALR